MKGILELKLSTAEETLQIKIVAALQVERAAELTELKKRRWLELT